PSVAHTPARMMRRHLRRRDDIHHQRSRGGQARHRIRLCMQGCVHAARRYFRERALKSDRRSEPAWTSGPRTPMPPKIGAVSEPRCPACASEHTYELNELLVCSMCAHEWSPAADPEPDAVIRDAVGNVLADGDTVTVVKALKVKGSPTGIKAGTKVRNIR